MLKKNKDQQALYFILFLGFVAVIGIAVYFLATPAIVGKHFTMDGNVETDKLKVLSRLRSLTLFTSVILLLIVCILLLLVRRPSYSSSMWVQGWLERIMAFDLESFLRQKWKSITRQNKTLFLVNVLLIFFSHGFLLNNIIINWDGQGGLDFSSLAVIPSGRWFTAFLGIFSEHHYLPVPFFLVAVIFLALSGVALTNLFQGLNFLQKVLISALLVCFPSFAAGFSYNWFSPVYPIACFLVLSSVNSAVKPGKANLLLAMLLFVLMLGAYQGFMSVGYGLFLIYFLIQLLEEKGSAGFLLKRFLLVGLGAPLIYKLISDGILYFIGMDYYDYRGANQIGVSYIMDHFLENFSRAYETLKYFFSGVYFSMPFYLLGAMVLLCAIVLFVITYVSVKSKKSRYKTPLIIALIGLAPPVIFSTQFLNTYIDSLLVFGMIPVLVGAYYIITKLGSSFAASLSTMLILLIVIGFVNRSNTIHLKNYLWTQTSLRFATDIALRVGALPGFSVDKKLVRFGDLSQFKFPTNKNAPFSDSGMTMVAPTGLSTWGGARTLNGMMNYLGFEYQHAQWSAVPAETQAKVKEMSIYPEEGSIQVLDDFVIIKLSENKSVSQP
ncbi:MAG: glucosyltransferase domain-containing protein [Bacteroidota bacterium]